MIIFKTVKFFSRAVLPVAAAVFAAAVILCLSVFFHARDTTVDSNGVEIFDIGKGKVVKQVGNDRQTRREAEELLRNISGLYLKFKPLPDKGCIIRIPLEPPAGIKNKWLNGSGIDSAGVLFILLPEESEPYLLVLDGENKPRFFYTNGNTDGLIRYLLEKYQ